MNINQLLKIAKEELNAPKFEVTKQFLDVNKVEQNENGDYICDRYDINNKENAISFYFKIKEEEYFLCVIVNINDNLVKWIYPENSNRCYLTATSEELSLKELSGITKLRYSSGWSKGDKRKNGSTYNFSRINFEFFEKKSYDMENLLSLVLDILEKDKEGVTELTKKAFTHIAICKYQYINANSGIHLDIKTIERLSKLNLELDIDMYIVGNQYKE